MIPLHVLVGMSCISIGCILILIALAMFLKRYITNQNYNAIETNQITKQNIAELMSDKTKVEHLMVLKAFLYRDDKGRYGTSILGYELRNDVESIYLHRISNAKLKEIRRDLIYRNLMVCQTESGRILTVDDLEAFTGVVYHELINERYIRKLLKDYTPDLTNFKPNDNTTYPKTKTVDVLQPITALESKNLEIHNSQK